MLRSRVCDYRDEYILVKGTITVANIAAQYADNNDVNKKIIFKDCAPFTNCISRINNTQVDDAHDIDTTMPMYYLIEYSDNYSKTSGILWQYCRGQLAVDNNGAIVDFTVAISDNDSFKIKEKNSRSNTDDGTKNFEIMVP